jgi:citrate lyase beta subunit
MATACHYLGLGATLYAPATRADLIAILTRHKLPHLRSVIICTEDAIHDHELPVALDNVEQALPHCSKQGPAVFIRVRNAQVLKRVINMPGITHIEGIVWPKATPNNVPLLAELVADQPRLWVMPTLETADAFDRRRLETLREALRQLINPVLCLRIGGSDLLRLLNLKRPKAMTIYDTPLGAVIDDIVLTFAPAGYEIAAPVFEHLDSMTTLARETAIDVAHGLLSKTAIHPAQLPVIEAVYRVMPEDQELAKRILDPAASAVFQYAGQMCEPATHRRWAERLLLRTEIFGLLN